MTDLSLARHIAAVLADGAADIDPAETAEWCESLDALIGAHGPERARFLFDALLAHARRRGLRWLPPMTTPYVNSIALEAQPPFPGDLAMEQRLAALMRWNALAMVMRANRVETGGSSELGGHIASYASAADLFEVGFNHFFRARDTGCAPAVSSAIWFSSSRIRRPACMHGPSSRADSRPMTWPTTARNWTAPKHGARGLSSYPHPQLMPDFWQFPTGSMGIGPINAIYQARFMRYLQHRGLLDAAAGPQQRSGSSEDTSQQSTCLGLLRRRRNGRAGVDRRALAGGTRAARQLHLRHQLQPAAPRRPRARQRPHRRRARVRNSPAQVGMSSSACGAATGTCSSRATMATP